MAEKQKYFVDDNLISLLEDLPDDDKEKSLGLLHQLNLSNEHYLVGLTSLQPQTSPQEIDPVQNVVSYLPSGLDIAGFYSTSTQIKPLDIIEECKKCLADNDIKKAFGSSTILLLTLVSERPTLYSYNYVTEELTQLPLTSREDSILDSCILGRLSCTLRIGLEYKSKTFKNDLYKEIEVQKDTIRSSATAFRVSDSNILLFSEYNSKLNCQELLNHIEKDDEDEFDRKKKQKNVDFGKVVVHFELFAQSTGDDALENTISCAPVIRHDHGSFQQLDLQLPVDVVVYLHPDTLVRSLHHTLVTALCRQIDAMYRCLIANNQNGTFHTPVPFHMKPSKLSHLVTVVYPDGISEDDLESTRKGIHKLFLLPKTSPFFRRQNLYVFSDEKLPGGYLVNPHLGVSSANAKGCISTVQGRYTYHHYMQDRTDDNKWGCAYRSLQTLVSWFKLQGYTDKSVPTHKEIQKILVDIGDKEPKFIGSRQWIGSTEVSYVLDDLLGVSSKILFVSNGAELASKGRELANHFNEIGTPIMIGGGVLAHTILGVDFNEITGHIRFLILDPHYTGGEDLKVITDKGWCGWKGPDFWDQNAYYNLCMPQRPNMI